MIENFMLLIIFIIMFYFDRLYLSPGNGTMVTFVLLMGLMISSLNLFICYNDEN